MNLVRDNAVVDADAIHNFLDDGSDGDSISDLVEGEADTDGGGGPDYLQSAINRDTKDSGLEASNTILVRYKELTYRIIKLQASCLATMPAIFTPYPF